MVNVDSELYKAHPDWAMDIPGKNHSEGRNQRLLDLSRAEVQDYIIGQMSDLFSSANIAYVKWDMNRIVTDYYSKILPPERQGGGGTPLCAWTLPVYEGVDRAIPGNFI